MSDLTGRNNYFEDFAPGQRFLHARGKTVGELENVLLTHLVMNTAEAHFNEHRMAGEPVGQRIVFGGVTASIVIGLASQDTSDNAVEELGLENMRLARPVVHGDTLYAATEVRSTEPHNDLSGNVTFRHWGINQHDEVVVELDRHVRIRRRTVAVTVNGATATASTAAEVESV